MYMNGHITILPSYIIILPKIIKNEIYHYYIIINYFVVNNLLFYTLLNLN